MSEMSDATAKEEVKACLLRAKSAMQYALLWPRGMSVEDFHDLKNMQEVIEEMLGEKK